MSLFDDAVDLQLKLDAAQTADASHDSIAKAQELVNALESTTAYLRAVDDFRRAVGVAEAVPVEVKAITAAVNAFRGGVSQRGAAAFQQQYAVSLVSTAKSQRDRVSKWIKARWSDLFTPYESAIQEAETAREAGRGSYARTAQMRASTLKAVRGLDPVVDAEQVKQSLGVTSPADQWKGAIADVAAQLESALASLASERDALTPEVRHALERAATSDGLPLDEVTDELRTALRQANVEHLLVVRRQ